MAVVRGTERIVMARLIRRGEDDGLFDLEFWDRIGEEGRFKAAWEMVGETQAIRGHEHGESRLQRSIACIKRR